MDSFYLFLPSNTKVASTKQPENNIPANFTIRYPNVIDLSDGEWTVALSSIIYPVSFSAEIEEEYWIEIHALKSPDSKIFDKKYVKILKDRFESVTDLQNSVNEQLITLLDSLETQKAGIAEKLSSYIPKIRAKREETAKEEVNTLPLIEEKKFKEAYNEVKVRSNNIRKKFYDEDKEGNIEGLWIDLSRASYNAYNTMHKLEFELLPFLREHYKEIDIYEFKQMQIDLETIYNSLKIAKGKVDTESASIRKLNEEYEEMLKEFDKDYADRVLARVHGHGRTAKLIVEKLKALEQSANSFITVINDEIKKVNLKEDLISNELRVPMPEAQKLNMTRVIAKIKKTIKEKFNDLKVILFYDDTAGKFFIFNNKPSIIRKIRMSEALAYHLGFVLDKEGFVQEIRFVHGGGFAKYSPDISTGIHQIYVYMPDLIQNSYVGDVMAPILRVVNCDKSINTIDEKTYNPEYHHRLIQKRITSINIQLRTQSGNLVRFNWGDVIVTLHFQRALF